MHGKGNFFDPRLDDAAKFPVAARNGFGHVSNPDDQITAKLAALNFYQLPFLRRRRLQAALTARQPSRGKATVQRQSPVQFTATRRRS